MNSLQTQTHPSTEPATHLVMKERHACAKRLLLRYCAASLLLIWVPGCLFYRPPPDPLAEWHVYVGDKVPLQITEDYREYIKALPERERQFVGPISFFKDDSGRFAVKIEVALYGTFKMHVIIYDSANKRVKVIRYNGGHYMS